MTKKTQKPIIELVGSNREVKEYAYGNGTYTIDDDILDQIDKQRCVDSAFAELDSVSAQAVKLCLLDQMELCDIAKTLKIPQKRVKILLANARNVLGRFDVGKTQSNDPQNS